MDLLPAIFFALLLGMLIRGDKRAGVQQAIDDKEYKILKQLVNEKIVKLVKERSRKEKSAVVKFCRSKGKYTVSDGDTSAF